MAVIPLHHVAARRTVPSGRRRHPDDRRTEDVRHDLRHHQRRARPGVRDPQSLPLPAGLCFLQHRQCVPGGGYLLRPRDGVGAAAALRPGTPPMDVAAVPAAPLRRRPRLRIRRWLRKAGFAFSVVVIVSPAILVFLWMLSLALKNEIDNIAYPPIFIPSPPTFANFIAVFEHNSIGRYFWDSIVGFGGATLIALLI